MAEANAPAPTPPKRGRTLFLVIGGVIVLALLAVAVALLVRNNKLAQMEAYAFSDNGAAGAASAPADKRQKPSHAARSGKEVFVPLEMFTANLADRDRDRFAQITIVVEAANNKAEAAFKAVQPVVRSDTLMLLTAKSANELLTLDGKQRLAGEVLEIARRHIAPDFRDAVVAVHFSSFVIQ